MESISKQDQKQPVFGGLRMMAVAAALLVLGGCSTVSDGWNSSVDTVSGWFGDGTPDADEIQPADAGGFPSVGSVPSERPQTSSDAEVAAATEGLIADRQQAQYTNQPGRQEPVPVRPLDATASAPSNEPPPPVAAPSVPVTTAGAAPQPGERVSLAERLGAAPPPPPNPNAPPPTLGQNPPAPVAPAPAPAVMTPPPAVEVGTQLASLSEPQPMSAFDPSRFSVSSHLATIQFESGSARLTAQDRRVLDDVVKVKNETGGVLRVVGHASSRTANLDPMRHKMVNFRISARRADEVATALIRKGVPADTIFVEAVSDSQPIYYEVMPAGDVGNQRAEIYLDY